MPSLPGLPAKKPVQGVEYRQERKTDANCFIPGKLFAVPALWRGEKKQKKPQETPGKPYRNPV